MRSTLVLHAISRDVDREATLDCFSDSRCVVAVGFVMGVGPGIAQVGDGVSNLEHVVTRDLASKVPEVTGDLAPIQHPSRKKAELIGELLEGSAALTALDLVGVVSCVDHLFGIALISHSTVGWAGAPAICGHCDGACLSVAAVAR